VQRAVGLDQRVHRQAPRDAVGEQVRRISAAASASSAALRTLGTMT
jgi:hypothetical protein